MNLSQVGNMREVVAQKPAQDLNLWTLVLEVMVEHFLQLFIVTEVLHILVEFLREGVDLDAFNDLKQQAIRQVSDSAD